MKILITQRRLQAYAGTEIFTAEIARALVARGHEVAIYCPKPGRITQLITPNGVQVKDSLDALPFTPDIIHGHHHLPLMAALARFEAVPAIHVCHGARPWVEQAPLHPRISRYVVTSRRMAPRLTVESGIPADRVLTIPNFVDTERYSHVRAVADRPAKAVLFGQYGFFPPELRQLETACAENGLHLDKVGGAYGNPRPRPEYFLPDYDIAFAVGRSALEAMACGCAVLPIVPQLAGHRITEARFDDWAAANFSPRYFTSADRFDSAWLAGELAGWHAGDIAAVTARVRAEFTLSRALDAFEALYREVLATPPAPVRRDDYAPYLEWIANEADMLWSQSKADERALEELKDRVSGLEAALAEKERQLADVLDSIARKRPA